MGRHDRLQGAWQELKLGRTLADGAGTRTEAEAELKRTEPKRTEPKTEQEAEPEAEQEAEPKRTEPKTAAEATTPADAAVVPSPEPLGQDEA